ncbi:PfkB family carbohydrate kinase [Candidatus Enterococcus mansonii]|uniref:Carbohydrate kinase PfkB domain-containing protein n=1 Tax=Candidatus Enterococcus mansonii TaxID=1834181 RepID=A0ABU8IDU3_9ENTE
MTQLEIPLETVGKGLRIAKEKGAVTILNPAPFDDRIVRHLDVIDIITPNETEFEGLIGHGVDETELETEMLAWSKKHQTKLIVTRGAQGVSYVWNDEVITIPACKIEVLDTTGAGDTFNGILAALLSRKTDYQEAIRLASIGASLSTTKIGAQTGMPTQKQLDKIKA